MLYLDSPLNNSILSLTGEAFGIDPMIIYVMATNIAGSVYLTIKATPG